MVLGKAVVCVLLASALALQSTAPVTSQCTNTNCSAVYSFALRFSNAVTSEAAVTVDFPATFPTFHAARCYGFITRDQRKTKAFCTCVDRTVKWSLGSIAAGETVTFTVTSVTNPGESGVTDYFYAKSWKAATKTEGPASIEGVEITEEPRGMASAVLAPSAVAADTLLNLTLTVQFSGVLPAATWFRINFPYSFSLSQLGGCALISTETQVVSCFSEEDLPAVHVTGLQTSVSGTFLLQIRNIRTPKTSGQAGPFLIEALMAGSYTVVEKSTLLAGVQVSRSGSSLWVRASNSEQGANSTYTATVNIGSNVPDNAVLEIQFPQEIANLTNCRARGDSGALACELQAGLVTVTLSKASEGSEVKTQVAALNPSAALSGAFSLTVKSPSGAVLGRSQMSGIVFSQKNSNCTVNCELRASERPLYVTGALELRICPQEDQVGTARGTIVLTLPSSVVLEDGNTAPAKTLKCSIGSVSPVLRKCEWSATQRTVTISAPGNFDVETCPVTVLVEVVTTQAVAPGFKFIEPGEQRIGVKITSFDYYGEEVHREEIQVFYLVRAKLFATAAGDYPAGSVSAASLHATANRANVLSLSITTSVNLPKNFTFELEVAANDALSFASALQDSSVAPLPCGYDASWPCAFECTVAVDPVTQVAVVRIASTGEGVSAGHSGWVKLAGVLNGNTVGAYPTMALSSRLPTGEAVEQGVVQLPPITADTSTIAASAALTTSPLVSLVQSTDTDVKIDLVSTDSLDAGDSVVVEFPRDFTWPLAKDKVTVVNCAGSVNQSLQYQQLSYEGYRAWVFTATRSLGKSVSVCLRLPANLYYEHSAQVAVQVIRAGKVLHEQSLPISAARRSLQFQVSEIAPTGFSGISQQEVLLEVNLTTTAEVGSAGSLSVLLPTASFSTVSSDCRSLVNFPQGTACAVTPGFAFQGNNYYRCVFSGWASRLVPGRYSLQVLAFRQSSQSLSILVVTAGDSELQLLEVGQSTIPASSASAPSPLLLQPFTQPGSDLFAGKSGALVFAFQPSVTVPSSQSATDFGYVKVSFPTTCVIDRLNPSTVVSAKFVANEGFIQCKFNAVLAAKCVLQDNDVLAYTPPTLPLSAGTLYSLSITVIGRDQEEVGFLAPSQPGFYHFIVRTYKKDVLAEEGAQWVRLAMAPFSHASVTTYNQGSAQFTALRFTLQVNTAVPASGLIYIEFPLDLDNSGHGWQSDLGTGLSNYYPIDCVSRDSVPLKCTLMFGNLDEVKIRVKASSALPEDTILDFVVMGIKNPDADLFNVNLQISSYDLQNPGNPSFTLLDDSRLQLLFSTRRGVYPEATDTSGESQLTIEEDQGFLHISTRGMSIVSGNCLFVKVNKALGLATQATRCELGGALVTCDFFPETGWILVEVQSSPSAGSLLVTGPITNPNFADDVTLGVYYVSDLTLKRLTYVKLFSSAITYALTATNNFAELSRVEGVLEAYCIDMRANFYIPRTGKIVVTFPVALATALRINSCRVGPRSSNSAQALNIQCIQNGAEVTLMNFKNSLTAGTHLEVCIDADNPAAGRYQPFFFEAFNSTNNLTPIGAKSEDDVGFTTLPLPAPRVPFAAGVQYIPPVQVTGSQTAPLELQLKLSSALSFRETADYDYLQVSSSPSLTLAADGQLRCIWASAAGSYLSAVCQLASGVMTVSAPLITTINAQESYTLTLTALNTKAEDGLLWTVSRYVFDVVAFVQGSETGHYRAEAEVLPAALSALDIQYDHTTVSYRNRFVVTFQSAINIPSYSQGGRIAIEFPVDFFHFRLGYAANHAAVSCATTGLIGAVTCYVEEGFLRPGVNPRVIVTGFLKVNANSEVSVTLDDILNPASADQSVWVRVSVLDVRSGWPGAAVAQRKVGLLFTTTLNSIESATGLLPFAVASNPTLGASNASYRFLVKAPTNGKIVAGDLVYLTIDPLLSGTSAKLTATEANTVKSAVYCSTSKTIILTMERSSVDVTVTLSSFLNPKYQAQSTFVYQEVIVRNRAVVAKFTSSAVPKAPFTTRTSGGPSIARRDGLSQYFAGDQIDWLFSMSPSFLVRGSCLKVTLGSSQFASSICYNDPDAGSSIPTDSRCTITEDHKTAVVAVAADLTNPTVMFTANVQVSAASDTATFKTLYDCADPTTLMEEPLAVKVAVSTAAAPKYHEIPVIYTAQKLVAAGTAGSLSFVVVFEETFVAAESNIQVDLPARLSPKEFSLAPSGTLQCIWNPGDYAVLSRDCATLYAGDMMTVRITAVDDMPPGAHNITLTTVNAEDVNGQGFIYPQVPKAYQLTTRLTQSATTKIAFNTLIVVPQTRFKTLKISVGHSGHQEINYLNVRFTPSTKIPTAGKLVFLLPTKDEWGRLQFPEDLGLSGNSVPCFAPETQATCSVIRGNSVLGSPVAIEVSHFSVDQMPTTEYQVSFDGVYNPLEKGVDDSHISVIVYSVNESGVLLDASVYDDLFTVKPNGGIDTQPAVAPVFTGSAFSTTASIKVTFPGSAATASSIHIVVASFPLHRYDACSSPDGESISAAEVHASTRWVLVPGQFSGVTVTFNGEVQRLVPTGAVLRILHIQNDILVGDHLTAEMTGGTFVNGNPVTVKVVGDLYNGSWSQVTVTYQLKYPVPAGGRITVTFPQSTVDSSFCQISSSADAALQAAKCVGQDRSLVITGAEALFAGRMVAVISRAEVSASLGGVAVYTFGDAAGTMFIERDYLTDASQVSPLPENSFQLHIPPAEPASVPATSGTLTDLKFLFTPTISLPSASDTYLELVTSWELTTNAELTCSVASPATRISCFCSFPSPAVIHLLAHKDLEAGVQYSVTIATRGSPLYGFSAPATSEKHSITLTTFVAGARTEMGIIPFSLVRAVLPKLTITPLHISKADYNVYTVTATLVESIAATDFLVVEFPTFTEDGKYRLFADDLGTGLPTGSEMPCLFLSGFTSTPRCSLIHGSGDPRYPAQVRIANPQASAGEITFKVAWVRNPPSAAGLEDSTIVHIRVYHADINGYVVQERTVHNLFAVDDTSPASMTAGWLNGLVPMWGSSGQQFNINYNLPEVEVTYAIIIGLDPVTLLPDFTTTTLETVDRYVGKNVIVTQKTTSPISVTGLTVANSSRDVHFRVILVGTVDGRNLAVAAADLILKVGFPVDIYVSNLSGTPYFPAGCAAYPLLFTIRSNSIIPPNAFFKIEIAGTELGTFEALDFGLQPPVPILFPSGQLANVRFGTDGHSLYMWGLTTEIKVDEVLKIMVGVRMGAASFCTLSIYLDSTMTRRWGINTSTPFSLPCYDAPIYAVSAVPLPELQRGVELKSLSLYFTTAVSATAGSVIIVDLKDEALGCAEAEPPTVSLKSTGDSTIYTLKISSFVDRVLRLIVSEAFPKDDFRLTLAWTAFVCVPTAARPATFPISLEKDGEIVSFGLAVRDIVGTSLDAKLWVKGSTTAASTPSVLTLEFLTGEVLANGLMLVQLNSRGGQGYAGDAGMHVPGGTRIPMYEESGLLQSCWLMSSGTDVNLPCNIVCAVKPNTPTETFFRVVIPNFISPIATDVDVITRILLYSQDAGEMELIQNSQYAESEYTPTGLCSNFSLSIIPDIGNSTLTFNIQASAPRTDEDVFVVLIGPQYGFWSAKISMGRVMVTDNVPPYPYVIVQLTGIQSSGYSFTLGNVAMSPPLGPLTTRLSYGPGCWNDLTITPNITTQSRRLQEDDTQVTASFAEEDDLKRPLLSDFIAKHNLPMHPRRLQEDDSQITTSFAEEANLQWSLLHDQWQHKLISFNSKVSIPAGVSIVYMFTGGLLGDAEPPPGEEYRDELGNFPDVDQGFLQFVNFPKSEVPHLRWEFVDKTKTGGYFRVWGFTRPLPIKTDFMVRVRLRIASSSTYRVVVLKEGNDVENLTDWLLNCTSHGLIIDETGVTRLQDLSFTASPSLQIRTPITGLSLSFTTGVVLPTPGTLEVRLSHSYLGCALTCEIPAVSVNGVSSSSVTFSDSSLIVDLPIPIAAGQRVTVKATWTASCCTPNAATYVNIALIAKSDTVSLEQGVAASLVAPSYQVTAEVEAFIANLNSWSVLKATATPGMDAKPMDIVEFAFSADASGVSFPKDFGLEKPSGSAFPLWTSSSVFSECWLEAVNATASSTLVQCAVSSVWNSELTILFPGVKTPAVAGAPTLTISIYRSVNAFLVLQQISAAKSFGLFSTKACSSASIATATVENLEAYAVTPYNFAVSLVDRLYQKDDWLIFRFADAINATIVLSSPDWEVYASSLSAPFLLARSLKDSQTASLAVPLVDVINPKVAGTFEVSVYPNLMSSRQCKNYGKVEVTIAVPTLEDFEVFSDSPNTYTGQESFLGATFTVLANYPPDIVLAIRFPPASFESFKSFAVRTNFPSTALIQCQTVGDALLISQFSTRIKGTKALVNDILAVVSPQASSLEVVAEIVVGNYSVARGAVAKSVDSSVKFLRLMNLYMPYPTLLTRPDEYRGQLRLRFQAPTTLVAINTAVQVSADVAFFSGTEGAKLYAYFVSNGQRLRASGVSTSETGALIVKCPVRMDLAGALDLVIGAGNDGIDGILIPVASVTLVSVKVFDSRGTYQSTEFLLRPAKQPVKIEPFAVAGSSFTSILLHFTIETPALEANRPEIRVQFPSLDHEFLTSMFPADLLQGRPLDCLLYVNEVKMSPKCAFLYGNTDPLFPTLRNPAAIVLRTLGTSLVGSTRVQVLIHAVQTPAAGAVGDIAVLTGEVDINEVFTPKDYFPYINAVQSRIGELETTYGNWPVANSTVVHQSGVLYDITMDLPEQYTHSGCYMIVSIPAVYTFNPAVKVSVEDAVLKYSAFILPRSSQIYLYVNTGGASMHVLLSGMQNAEWIATSRSTDSIQIAISLGNQRVTEYHFTESAAAWTPAQASVSVLSNTLYDGLAHINSMNVFTAAVTFPNTRVPPGGGIVVEFPSEFADIDLFPIGAGDAKCQRHLFTWECAFPSGRQANSQVTVTGRVTAPEAGTVSGDIVVTSFSDPELLQVIAKGSGTIGFVGDLLLRTRETVEFPMQREVLKYPAYAGGKGILSITFQLRAALPAGSGQLAITEDSIYTSSILSVPSDRRLVCKFTNLSTQVSYRPQSWSLVAGTLTVTAPTQVEISSTERWRLTVYSSTGLDAGLTLPWTDVCQYGIRVKMTDGSEFSEMIRNNGQKPATAQLDLASFNAGNNKNFAVLAIDAVINIRVSLLLESEVRTPGDGFLESADYQTACSTDLGQTPDFKCQVRSDGWAYHRGRVIRVDVVNFVPFAGGVPKNFYFGNIVNPTVLGRFHTVGVHVSEGDCVRYFAQFQYNFEMRPPHSATSLTLDSFIPKLSSRIVSAPNVFTTGHILYDVPLESGDYIEVAFPHAIGASSKIKTYTLAAIPGMQAVFGRFFGAATTRAKVDFSDLTNPSVVSATPVVTVYISSSKELKYIVTLSKENADYQPEATAVRLNAPLLQHVFSRYEVSVSLQVPVAQKLGFTVQFPPEIAVGEVCYVDTWLQSHTRLQSHAICSVQDGVATVSPLADKYLEGTTIAVAVYLSTETARDYVITVNAWVASPTALVASGTVLTSVRDNSPAAVDCTLLSGKRNPVRTGMKAPMVFTVTPNYDLLKGVGRVDIKLPDNMVKAPTEVKCLWNDGQTSVIASACTYLSSTLSVKAPLNSPVLKGTSWKITAVADVDGFLYSLSSAGWYPATLSLYPDGVLLKGFGADSIMVAPPFPVSIALEAYGQTASKPTVLKLAFSPLTTIPASFEQSGTTEIRLSFDSSVVGQTLGSTRVSQRDESDYFGRTDCGASGSSLACYLRRGTPHTGNRTEVWVRNYAGLSANSVIYIGPIFNPAALDLIVSVTMEVYQFNTAMKHWDVLMYVERRNVYSPGLPAGSESGEIEYSAPLSDNSVSITLRQATAFSSSGKDLVLLTLQENVPPLDGTASADGVVLIFSYHRSILLVPTDALSTIVLHSFRLTVSVSVQHWTAHIYKGSALQTVVTYPGVTVPSATATLELYPLGDLHTNWRTQLTLVVKPLDAVGADGSIQVTFPGFLQSPSDGCDIETGLSGSPACTYNKVFNYFEVAKFNTYDSSAEGSYAIVLRFGFRNTSPVTLTEGEVVVRCYDTPDKSIERVIKKRFQLEVKSSTPQVPELQSVSVSLSASLRPATSSDPTAQISLSFQPQLLADKVTVAFPAAFTFPLGDSAKLKCVLGSGNATIVGRCEMQAGTLVVSEEVKAGVLYSLVAQFSKKAPTSNLATVTLPSADTSITVKLTSAGVTTNSGILRTKIQPPSFMVLRAKLGSTQIDASTYLDIIFVNSVGVTASWMVILELENLLLGGDLSCTAVSGFARTPQCLNSSGRLIVSGSEGLPQSEYRLLVGPVLTSTVLVTPFGDSVLGRLRIYTAQTDYSDALRYNQGAAVLNFTDSRPVEKKVQGSLVVITGNLCTATVTLEGFSGELKTGSGTLVFELDSRVKYVESKCSALPSCSFIPLRNSVLLEVNYETSVSIPAKLRVLFNVTIASAPESGFDLNATLLNGSEKYRARGVLAGAVPVTADFSVQTYSNTLQKQTYDLFIFSLRPISTQFSTFQVIFSSEFLWIDKKCKVVSGLQQKSLTESISCESAGGIVTVRNFTYRGGEVKVEVAARSPDYSGTTEVSVVLYRNDLDEIAEKGKQVLTFTDVGSPFDAQLAFSSLLRIQKAPAPGGSGDLRIRVRLGYEVTTDGRIDVHFPPGCSAPAAPQCFVVYSDFPADNFPRYSWTLPLPVNCSWSDQLLTMSTGNVTIGTKCMELVVTGKSQGVLLPPDSGAINFLVSTFEGGSALESVTGSLTIAPFTPARQCVPLCPEGVKTTAGLCTATNPALFSFSMNAKLKPVDSIGRYKTEETEAQHERVLLSANPVPTVGRGLYFFANQTLKITPNVTLSTDLTFDFTVKVAVPGLIWSNVASDGKVLVAISVSSDWLLQVQVGASVATTAVSMSRDWQRVVLVLSADPSGLVYYDVCSAGAHDSGALQGVVNDTQSGTAYFGQRKEVGRTFQGFLAAFEVANCAKTTTTCELQMTLSPCGVDQVADDKCTPCQRGCLSCMRSTDCSLCASPDCLCSISGDFGACDQCVPIVAMVSPGALLDMCKASCSPLQTSNHACVEVDSGELKLNCSSTSLQPYPWGQCKRCESPFQTCKEGEFPVPVDSLVINRGTTQTVHIDVEPRPYNRSNVRFTISAEAKKDVNLTYPEGIFVPANEAARVNFTVKFLKPVPSINGFLVTMREKDGFPLQEVYFHVEKVSKTKLTVVLSKDLAHPGVLEVMSVSENYTIFIDLVENLTNPIEISFSSEQGSLECLLNSTRVKCERFGIMGVDAVPLLLLVRDGAKSGAFKAELLGEDATNYELVGPMTFEVKPPDQEVPELVSLKVAEAAHSGAIIEVVMTRSARIYYLVTLRTDPPPSQLEVMVSALKHTNIEDFRCLIHAGELETDTEYIMWVVHEGLREQNRNGPLSLPFRTEKLTPEVSIRRGNPDREFANSK